MAIMSNRKLSYPAYFYDTPHPIKKAGTSIMNVSAFSKYHAMFNVFAYYSAVKSSSKFLQLRACL